MRQSNQALALLEETGRLPSEIRIIASDK